jgi:hypothetical protein
MACETAPMPPHANKASAPWGYAAALHMPSAASVANTRGSGALHEVARYSTPTILSKAPVSIRSNMPCDERTAAAAARSGWIITCDCVSVSCCWSESFLAVTWRDPEARPNGRKSPYRLSHVRENSLPTPQTPCVPSIQIQKWVTEQLRYCEA